MRYALSRIFRYCIHTEYVGSGRVLALMFFGGAGYLWRPGIWTRRPRPHRLTYVNLSGFTLYLRLRGRRARPHPWLSNSVTKPLGWVGITDNGNRYRLF